MRPNMAAASDGMFESSARPDRPLKSLEVESAHSSQGRSKKWSKLSVVSSPQPQPPPPEPPPHPHHHHHQTGGGRGEETADILMRHEW